MCALIKSETPRIEDASTEAAIPILKVLCYKLRNKKNPIKPQQG